MRIYKYYSGNFMETIQKFETLKKEISKRLAKATPQPKENDIFSNLNAQNCDFTTPVVHSSFEERKGAAPYRQKAVQQIIDKSYYCTFYITEILYFNHFLSD